jgi:predicted dithiol-disulfide oxidoreductase (DUF899 family)
MSSGSRRGARCSRRRRSSSRLRDELSRQQRALPWERVDEEYVFDGPEGRHKPSPSSSRGEPARRLPLPCSRRRTTRLPELLLVGRQLRPNVVHLNAPRHHVRRRLPRTGREAVRVPRAARLELQVGLVGRENRFNYDFGASFEPEEQDDPVYNYWPISPPRRPRGMKRLLPARKTGRSSIPTRPTPVASTSSTPPTPTSTRPKGRDEAGQWPQFWVRRRDEYGDG